MDNSLISSDENPPQSQQAISFLVVDDDARARKSLVALLNRQWPDITEAEDGEEAISLIQQRQFNLIILDLNMPKKSGDQVLTFIREKKIQTTVIVISGETSINKVTEAVRLGKTDACAGVEASFHATVPEPSSTVLLASTTGIFVSALFVCAAEGIFLGAGEMAESATSSFECTDANHERTSSITSSSEGDEDAMRDAGGFVSSIGACVGVFGADS